MTLGTFCDCCGDHIEGEFVEAIVDDLETAGHYCPACWKSLQGEFDGECQCELRPRIETPTHKRIIRSPTFWGWLSGAAVYIVADAIHLL